jgi:hypothetical protein
VNKPKPIQIPADLDVLMRDARTRTSASSQADYAAFARKGQDELV